MGGSRSRWRSTWAEGGRRSRPGGVRPSAGGCFVARGEDGWEPFALEINLREGGTSHPYGALWLLTDGALDDGKVTYRTPAGQPKYYFATDRLGDPAYRKITLTRFLAAAQDERIGWDAQTQTGAIFHM